MSNSIRYLSRPLNCLETPTLNKIRTFPFGVFPRYNVCYFKLLFISSQIDYIFDILNLKTFLTHQSCLLRESFSLRTFLSRDPQSRGVYLGLESSPLRDDFRSLLRLKFRIGHKKSQFTFYHIFTIKL